MKNKLALVVAASLLSGCATTNTGGLIRMPVESAAEGDVVSTIITTVAVPVLLPFFLIADVFDVLGVTEQDVQAVATVVQQTTEQMAQQQAAQQGMQQASATTPQLYPTANAPAGQQTPAGRIPIDSVLTCPRYEPLPRVVNYQYFKITNTCSFPIEVYYKVTEDGKWTTYSDITSEIPAGGSVKNPGVSAHVKMTVQLMVACPARSEMERRLNARLAGVYTQGDSGFGCWIIYETRGVGTAS